VSSDAYPLYPKIDTGPGPGRIALLRGPIAIVDGTSLSGKGPSFELLPGCHLVTPEPSATEGEANGKSSAHPRHILFTFEMRPGYVYTVETVAEASSGHPAKSRVIALERAPDGSAVRVQRARDSDVETCKDWAKSRRY
jgi:hypothetical protein